MTPDAAAWVREHAWTAAMRRTYAEVPGGGEPHIPREAPQDRVSRPYTVSPVSL